VYPYELEQAIADIEGVRRGCVAVFGVRSSESGTEQLVVLAETRETDAARRAALERRIHELTLEMLEMPADEVVLAPPGAVLKTSSGKIRRAALGDLYLRGLLGRAQRAVWVQFARLALASLAPRSRRALQRAGDLAFAAWMWLVLGAIFVLVWPTVLILPGIERRWRLVAAAARTLLALGGARPAASGLEQVPASGAFVLVANHSSYLDGVVLASVLPRRVSFVAKQELRAHPVAGPFLARIGCCFVERFDRARGAEDARLIGARLRDGEAVAFFPEGTLHRMPGLLPFHLGAFAAAAETGAPVIAVTVHGTRSVLRGDSLFPRRGRIRVHVSEPIPVPAPSPEDERTWQRAVALRDAARAEVLRHCAEPDLAGRRELSW
ncbi:MAG: 1-acyl-sn-glycerol-3-phosphate acyltransferase, partial [Gammaproteobacteria bacterium]|nr:1-acyl-sn-glycerol-3-phosphate acyltransferase [Gammaproteobacteria bacterium]